MKPWTLAKLTKKYDVCWTTVANRSVTGKVTYTITPTNVLWHKVGQWQSVPGVSGGQIASITRKLLDRLENQRLIINGIPVDMPILLPSVTSASPLAKARARAKAARARLAARRGQNNFSEKP